MFTARSRRRLRPRHLPAILRAPQGPWPRTPRVFVAGKLTALVSPGGGEVQMFSLLRPLREQGLDVQLWRPWEQRLAEADVLHLFGSEREHMPLVAAARQQQVPVVLSTIAWFDLASCWREPWPLAQRLAACAKYGVRAALPGIPSWRRRLYHACNLLLPNSWAESRQLTRLFEVRPQRMHVVPNGADPRFGEADPAPFARLAGGRGFVLVPGRVEPRKNQLGFLRAMRGAGVPIVVLGDAVAGHERYYDECRHAADAAVKFVSRIEHGNPLLASAYAACGCVALASWFETPGLVALEAGLSGVPLVLPVGGCAREYFGDLADYVSPDHPGQIRQRVLAALAKPRSADLARIVRQNYTWEAAARATREAYEKVL